MRDDRHQEIGLAATAGVTIYYDFPPGRSYPKPAQKPHPPVLLGRSAKTVLQRVVAWASQR